MRRPLAFAALLALGMALSVPSASAHALLDASEPARGAALEQAPAEVVLRFTEEPELSLSSVEVLDLDGGVRHTGDTRQDADDELVLRRGVGALEDGVYMVSWRVLSRVDGHLTAGTFAFGIGVDPAEIQAGALPDPPAPAPSPLETAARWLLLAGLAVVIGVCWMGVVSFGVVPARAVRLAWLGWASSAIGLVLLAEAQRRAAGASIGALLATTVGRALILRAIAIGAGALLLLAARARPGGASTDRAGVRGGVVIAAGAAAAAALFVHVGAGHAGTGSLLWAKVISQWVHVVAIGVWLGGLAALLAGLGTVEAPAERARAVRRFSTAAGVALFVVLATGMMRSLGELPGPGALVSSAYGRVIVLKMVLLVGLGVLGAVNRYRHVPVAAGSVAGLRRVSRVELGVAGVALLAGALLASMTPPRAVSATEEIAASPIEVTGTDLGRTTRVELTITPGFAGPNTFAARVTDLRSGRSPDAERARLLFRYLEDASLGETELTLERGDDGVYRGSGGTMGLPGRWRLTLLLQEAARAVEVPLQVATKCRAEGTPVEGGPTLYDIRTGAGTAQGYADPGATGFNEIHITFFDAEGTERDVAQEPAMFASEEGADTDRVELVVRRFSKGHFVGDAQLEPGLWRFDITARAAGETLQLCFNEEITG